MTIKYTTHLLNELVKMETPKNNGGDHLKYAEICHNYARVRNLAKDLLRNPGNKDLEKKLEDTLSNMTAKEDSLERLK